MIGSSPRVRGTLNIIGVYLWVLRFIPACAGNTHWLVINDVTLPVHPRVCGEHICAQWRRYRMTGSSPRVRGTHRGSALDTMPMRFIPACAGNTWFPRRQDSQFPVHPRVCGEHF